MSGTIIEPEGLAVPGKEREVRRSKGELSATSDKGRKSDCGRATKARGGKDPRKGSSRDDVRRAKETADEKDAAEDEANKREYIALQNKMEARRIAREIQTAHDTLASLCAEQEDVSAKTETVSKVRAEGDRAKGGDATGLKLEVKKSRATLPAVGTSVIEPEISSTMRPPRRTEEQNKTKSTKTGDGKTTEIAGVSKKTVAKSRAKGPTSATEPSRTTTGKIVAKSSDEDSMTELLGPALVAGALGRKIGDARTNTMMKGITECRVELLSTRQKAKLPVPVVPNNSAESNSVVDGAGTYDVRLSLSATDQHVQLKLPGYVNETTTETAILAKRKKVIVETINPEPRRVSLISVAKQGDGRQSRDEAVSPTGRDKAEKEAMAGMCGDDVPIATGEIATPVVKYTEITVRSGDQVITGKETRAVGKMDEDGNAAKVIEKRRLLREIDVATAMHEHLLEANPELANATSFLDAVCGRTYAPKKGKTNDPAVWGAGETRATETPPHTIKMLGREQPPSVKPGFGESVSGDRRTRVGEVESDSEHETTDVVVLEDTKMSEGETLGNESGSGSSSGGSSYGSGHIRASCKRAADESLEREHRRIGQQPFPGATSRGAGGLSGLPTITRDGRTRSDGRDNGE